VKAPSSFNTNTLQSREISQHSLLHLCSVLHLKNFLTMHTWAGELG